MEAIFGWVKLLVIKYMVKDKNRNGSIPFNRKQYIKNIYNNKLQSSKRLDDVVLALHFTIR